MGLTTNSVWFYCMLRNKYCILIRTYHIVTCLLIFPNIYFRTHSQSQPFYINHQWNTPRLNYTLSVDSIELLLSFDIVFIFWWCKLKGTQFKKVGMKCLKLYEYSFKFVISFLKNILHFFKIVSDSVTNKLHKERCLIRDSAVFQFYFLCWKLSSYWINIFS